ncbi:hypothetical protein [Capnocytophaga sp. H2931]|uniref:hypothetical protein n=1 Tax=Capnocytophaga sp. H2931 TaxID=1945657 RepID=UPI000BB1B274|nr:hypothetical protein [Capnocytophaga sp. H2931]ATA75249.1 hypothetical protein CGC52_07380 [Capnocytophaga sp. H2931]
MEKEKENKVKLLISAEGELNNAKDFKVHLVAEGGMFEISCVLAGLLQREDWLKKVVEQALEMAYEQ